MINVAILSGGWTEEKNVSHNSALSIMEWLKDSDKYNPVHVTNIDDLGNYTIVYNTIHGSPGENGLVQGYLELKGIKHTSSPVMASSITYSKFDTCLYVNALNIPDLYVSKSILLRPTTQVTSTRVGKIIGYPVFVKPNLGGSSIGASKVNTPDELDASITKAKESCHDVVIEKYLKGREFTCGIVNSKIIEVTEIIHGKEFFDYETKYSGNAKEVTPAQIDLSLRTKIERITKDIYDSLRCKGIARIDYILSNDRLYLLEVNTTPGMTDTSIIPQQVTVSGRTMKEVLESVLDRELS
jgi:D-alanine-D-alanine ligase